ncbi:hypothetical protein C7K25_05370 [Gulosibacter molinativorax]|uniref:Uncharacterized protein n=2 Tax=Gulosibacter molinativorax TaxID=256821 RepID=A0ABT7C7T6_9MICO|nr:hypothetical protein [Gulosibacter molinativorax]
MIGIMLFIIGGFATVVHMATLLPDALAQQAALAFEAYGLGDYHRAAGLEDFAWVGIVLHPLNYGVWLYVALKRWQKKKYGSWCAFAGAGVALIISMTVMVIAFAMHPEILAWVESGSPMPTPTPAPTP